MTTTPKPIPARIPLPNPAALSAVPDLGLLGLPPEIARLLDCLERVAEVFEPKYPPDFVLLDELRQAQADAEGAALARIHAALAYPA